jgi:hypothetical protein
MKRAERLKAEGLKAEQERLNDKRLKAEIGVASFGHVKKRRLMLFPNSAFSLSAFSLF